MRCSKWCGSRKKRVTLVVSADKHLQALVRALGRADEVAIVAKAVEVQLAQSLDEPRIDQVRLRFVQIDAGVGVEHRRDLAEIAVRHLELAGDQRFARAWLGDGRPLTCHAAFSNCADMRLSSSMRPIMRPSIASTPRTNELDDVGGDVRRGLNIFRRLREDVGDRVDEEADDLASDLDDDDDLARRRVGRGEAEAFGQIDDRQDGPAQVDDAAHVRGRVGQGGRGRPAADLAHRHDVDAEFLHSDTERDEFAGGPGGGGVYSRS